LMEYDGGRLAAAMIGLASSGISYWLSSKYPIEFAPGLTAPPGEVTRWEYTTRIDKDITRRLLSVWRRINVHVDGNLLVTIGFFQAIYLASDVGTSKGEAALYALLGTMIPVVLRMVAFTRCCLRTCKPSAPTENCLQKTSVVVSNAAVMPIFFYFMTLYALDMIVAYFLEEAQGFTDNFTDPVSQTLLSTMLLSTAFRFVAVFAALGAVFHASEGEKLKTMGRKGRKEVAEVMQQAKPAKTSVVTTLGAVLSSEDTKKEGDLVRKLIAPPW
jgi:hypothetical protein